MSKRPWFAVLASALLVAGCAAAPTRTSSSEERGSASHEGDAANHDDAPLGRDSVQGQGDDAGDRGDAGRDDAGDASNSPSALIADEPIYVPGARRRAASVAAQTSEDAEIARWNGGGGAVSMTAQSERQKPAHPAPRIKVDVPVVRGKVDEGEVLKQVRAKGYWPFRLCYEDGLRRAPKLRGGVRLRLTLDTHGHAHRPKKLSSDLPDSQLVDCVLKAAGALTLSLAAPVRGTPEINVEVALYPGDEPVGPRENASGGPRGTDLSAVTRALRETWPHLRACYAGGLARDQALWGRLAVRLVVATRGRVSEATEVESRFPDPAVTACVCRVLAGLDGLAAPDGTRLVYPLRFGAPANDGGTTP